MEIEINFNDTYKEPIGSLVHVLEMQEIYPNIYADLLYKT